MNRQSRERGQHPSCRPPGEWSRATLSGIRSRRRPPDQDGFALVIAIWAMGAVALLFTTYIAAARYRSIEASATLDHARARAFAEAGINLAILDLLAEEAAGRRAGLRQKVGEQTRVCGIGAEALVAVSVGNENGRIDLNTADPELLRTAFLRLLGTTDRARRVTAAILSGRQARAPPAANGGAPATIDTPPRVQAFRSVVEAGAMPEFDASTYAVLAPFLTIHSRSAGINPALAPPALRDVLTRTDANPARGSADSSLFFVADAPGSVYRVAAEAVTMKGTRVSREAIVELDRGPPLGFKVREWRDGAGRLAPQGAWAAAGLSPC